MLSEFIADILPNTHPQCITSDPSPHLLLADSHRSINDFNHLNEIGPEVRSTTSNDSTATATPSSSQESTSFLDDAFFAVDFPLFDDDDNIGSRGSGTIQGRGQENGLGLEFPAQDLPYHERASTSTTSAPAHTYIDEENSYLLTSLEEFLAQHTPLDMFLTDPTTSTPATTTTNDTLTTSPATTSNSVQDLTPHPSPEPAIQLSTQTTPVIPTSATVSPALAHVAALPTPSASPLSGSRKRKSPNLGECLDSPRIKELPPIQITPDDDERDVKRKRNTAAARRYRQKKQDRMQQLEEELEAMREEKEMWRQEAMKQKMEAEKYQALVGFLQNSRQQEK